MIKVHQFFVMLFLCCFSNSYGQNIKEILTKNQWSAYDNFAVIQFLENGKAEIEYAYCTYCQGNKEIVDWTLRDKILTMGKDSLNIQTANKNEIKTSQYNQIFTLTQLSKIKATKLKKEDILSFLVSNEQLNITVKSIKFDNNSKQPVQFQKNGKMWLDSPNYRGQWALKYFYGNLFLVYIHRNTINRDFPLLKIKSLKKGKLIGQPIPSITKGAPFFLEFSN